MFGSVHMTNKDFIVKFAAIITEFNNGKNDWTDLKAKVDFITVSIFAPKERADIGVTFDVRNPLITVRNKGATMEIWLEGDPLVGTMVMNTIERSQIKAVSAHNFLTLTRNNISVGLLFSR